MSRLLALFSLLPALALAQGYQPPGWGTTRLSPTRADTAASYTATPVSLGALGSCAALAGTFASVDGDTAEPYFCDGVDWSPIATSKTLPTLLKEAMLGMDLSARSLVLTENNTEADALVVLGGRVRLVPYEIASNAYFMYDTSTGFYFANQLNLADGAFLTADNLSPKRNTQSLSVYGTYGMTLVCQSTLGTCGTSPQVEGTIKTMCATASSKTRTCQCTASSNSSPTWAWENNLGVAGDATTCPEVVP